MLLWGCLLAILTLLVQARLVAPFDAAGLQVIVSTRSVGLSDDMNWIFRLGYAQVDAALAFALALWALATRRSLRTALPPLVIVLVVAIQVLLRLAIDQPGPGAAYAIPRPFVAQPVGRAVDVSDAVARETFATAAAPAGSPARVIGSFPSGHASRALFLALLLGDGLGLPRGRASRVVRSLGITALLALAGLVGYSALHFGYHWPSDVLGGYFLALGSFELALLLKKSGITLPRSLSGTSPGSP